MPVEDIDRYMVLVGTQHVDDEDGLTYQVSRVTVDKRLNLIVCYRKLVLKDNTVEKREQGPFHV